MESTPLWERHLDRRDRGSGLVQGVIGAFVVVVLMLLVFQLCMWLHAYHVAAAAAQTALATGRTEDGTVAAASGEGEDLLARNAGGSLIVSAITVDQGAETVTVTVTGEAPSLLPALGLDWPVEVQAVGPRERFVPAGGQ
ncbi:pilus assembly protein TadE [Glycomyces sp. NPDC047369]